MLRLTTRAHHVCLRHVSSQAAITSRQQARHASGRSNLNRASLSATGPAVYQHVTRRQTRHASGKSNRNPAPPSATEPLIRKHASGKSNLKSASLSVTGPDVRSTEAKPPDFSEPFCKPFLRWKKHTHNPRELTATWIEAIRTERAKASLAPHLRDDPLSAFEDVAADMDTVIAALEMIVSSAHRDHATREDGRHIHQDQQTGRKALLWYMGSKAFDGFTMVQHPRFYRLLAHCIVAEGAEHHALRLLNRDYGHHQIETGMFNRATWKGWLLKSLVQANTYWASEPSKSFEDGFRCFKESFDATGTPRQTGRYIPLNPSAEYLERFLILTHTEALDHRVFERYLDVVAMLLADEFEIAFKTSRLWLVHPSHPSPQRALEVMQQVEQEAGRNPSVNRIFGQRGENATQMLRNYVFLTFKLLKQQARMAKARWVVDFARSNMPDVFAPALSGNPFRNRPDVVRRRATPYEIEMGAKVDEHGHLISGEDYEQKFAKNKEEGHSKILLPRKR